MRGRELSVVRYAGKKWVSNVSAYGTEFGLG